jgi:hypothetical protein
MRNSDWRQVYRDERRRPGYVIDNGKPTIKLQPNDACRQPSIVGIKCLWSGNRTVQAPQELLINMNYVNFGVKK